jgi:predicted DNA-binding transcriptional regulator AlpA
MSARHTALPPTLAPRGLSRPEAAAYIGVGVCKFDRLVEAGQMPRAKDLGGRKVWDRHALDIAFAALPDEAGAPSPGEAAADRWDSARV